MISNARKDAEQNSVVARGAQLEAQRRLEEVVSKERERQKAQAAERAAQSQVVTAEKKVEMTNEEPAA